MNAIEILEKAAWRECPGCMGDYIAKHRCEECGGTGLWLPDLSLPCARTGYLINDQPIIFLTGRHTSKCPDCHGTNLVLFLDDPERLDAAAERLGYPVYIHTPGWHQYLVSAKHIDAYQVIDSGYGLDRQAALAAVIQSVWPEVQDA